MAIQQTPRPQRSPWMRYAPVIAVVVVIAIVAVILATRGGDDEKEPSVSAGSPTTVAGEEPTRNVPIIYSEAEKAGTLDKYTWQDHCDPETGRVAMPVLNPSPCVPKVAAADNGGATAPGVTADTIKIGYYIAKPDPAAEALLKLVGAYDPPDDTAQAAQNYIDIYANNYELAGRKIELVRIDGTGLSSDDVAARADADRAAAAGVFAMLSGPAQSPAFADQLASKKVLCVGTCIIARPQSFYDTHAPYVWPVAPSPEQTSSMVAEFIGKQLVGKNAEYTDEPLKSQKRTFVLLTYDTPDGVFKESWDDLEQKLKDANADVVDHVSYFLDVATIPADARTVATRLKATGATTIVFTGDPLFPNALTHEMTQQGYFPEWVLSGTVFADTNVFARSFDTPQWKHAFGLQLTPAKLPKTAQDAYLVHEWWFGTEPPTQNNFAVVEGNVALLFQGLQLAGPELTPETFQEAQFHMPPAEQGENGIRTITAFGEHGFWPFVDNAGLDNSGLLWWDPDTSGPDETGAVKSGVYRSVDGGRRYLPGEWPTTPIKLFDPAGTVTVYTEDDVPPDLLPKEYPVPADAPAKNE